MFQITCIFSILYSLKIDIAAKIVTNDQTWKHFPKLSSAAFGWAFNTNLFLCIVELSSELIESQGQKNLIQPLPKADLLPSWTDVSIVKEALVA